MLWASSFYILQVSSFENHIKASKLFGESHARTTFSVCQKNIIGLIQLIMTFKIFKVQIVLKDSPFDLGGKKSFHNGKGENCDYFAILTMMR